MSDTETWQQWTKQPGDDGWLKVAISKHVRWYAIGFLILLVLAVPALMLIFGSDVPTRVRLGTGAMYICALFGLATASDRAVQLERRRRRESDD